MHGDTTRVPKLYTLYYLPKKQHVLQTRLSGEHTPHPTPPRPQLPPYSVGLWAAGGMPPPQQASGSYSYYSLPAAPLPEKRVPPWRSAAAAAGGPSAS